MHNSSPPELLGGFRKRLRLKIQAFEPETEKCVCILLGQTANLYGIGLGHGENEILAGESTEGRPRGDSSFAGCARFLTQRAQVDSELLGFLVKMAALQTE